MPNHKQNTSISPSKAQVTLLAEEVGTMREQDSWPHSAYNCLHKTSRSARDRACQSSVSEGEVAYEALPFSEDSWVASGC